MSETEPRLVAVEADITGLAVDAIVNAANDRLAPGGGVCGAIHRAAGPDLAEACRAIGGCPTGEARITPGFRLPARFVIHAVGPVWQGGGQDEAALLESCYRASLALAVENGARTVAFPAISTGVYGFPLDAATRIAVTTVAEVLAGDGDAGEARIERVTFCCFGAEALAAYQRELAALG